MKEFIYNITHRLYWFLGFMLAIVIVWFLAWYLYDEQAANAVLERIGFQLLRIAAFIFFITLVFMWLFRAGPFKKGKSGHK